LLFVRSGAGVHHGYFPGALQAESNNSNNKRNSVPQQCWGFKSNNNSNKRAPTRVPYENNSNGIITMVRASTHPTLLLLGRAGAGSGRSRGRDFGLGGVGFEAGQEAQGTVPPR